jgi:NhaC family Na+:H+ antiporter
MATGDSSGESPAGDAETSVPLPSLFDSILPLATLAVLIGGSLALFGLDALDGPIQVALILCALVAALIAMKNGRSYQEVEEATRASVASVTSAIFILLAVGALIGVWNLAGTIPTLVYYGIQLLSPGWFYAATAVICGLVAMSIGSSWTTAGTIGVGLVGIAVALDVSPVITAGAVVSGAYLGDKLSPLSETTVLTYQLVGVNVYEHVKRQAWTSVPAFVIAVIGFTILGIVKGTDAHVVPETIELRALGDVYHITPLNLLPWCCWRSCPSAKSPPPTPSSPPPCSPASAAPSCRPTSCRASRATGVARCSSRSRPCGRPWPPASRWTRASTRSTGWCRAAAWPACCRPSG